MPLRTSIVPANTTALASISSSRSTASVGPNWSSSQQASPTRRRPGRRARPDSRPVRCDPAGTICSRPRRFLALTKFLVHDDRRKGRVRPAGRRPVQGGRSGGAAGTAGLDVGGSGQAGGGADVRSRRRAGKGWKTEGRRRISRAWSARKQERAATSCELNRVERRAQRALAASGGRKGRIARGQMLPPGRLQSRGCGRAQRSGAAAPGDERAARPAGVFSSTAMSRSWRCAGAVPVRADQGGVFGRRVRPPASRHRPGAGRSSDPSAP